MFARSLNTTRGLVQLYLEMKGANVGAEAGVPILWSGIGIEVFKSSDVSTKFQVVFVR